MESSGPTLEQLLIRLARLLPSTDTFAETAFRSSTPQYAAEPDLLTGEGSRRHGGRWNPIGIAALHAPLTPESAMAETLAHHRYYGLPVEDAMPRMFVAMEARLRSVLDFRRGSVRQRIRVSLDRIMTLDWRKEVRAGRDPITQTIGRAASQLGWEGMVVPSAADPKGCNLLVFPQNLQSGSEVRVLHPDRLAN